MSFHNRTLPFVWPALVACAAAGVIFIVLTSLAARSPSTQRRFAAWEERGTLEPGQLVAWAAMVYAVNTETPGQPPQEFLEAAPRMQRLFGYNQFDILDDTELVIDRNGARWFVPTEQLYLGLRLLGPAPEGGGRQKLNFQIWREETLLVDADTTLAPGSPLFIRGPEKANGHLLFAIQIGQPTEADGKSGVSTP